MKGGYNDIDEILESGILSGFKGTPEGHLGGKYVQLLEQAFREYFGCNYAIAMQSATAALNTALLASGVGPGHEVIVSPYSFSASASCVLMAGAKPVFVDVDEDTFCITPENILKAVTSQTKAIIPVHLCGQGADIEQIMEIAASRNLRVIEDAAQSITAQSGGKYLGTFGDCGVFSFNQSKHINTGEGGMLICDSQWFADRCRAIRNHGEVSVPEMKILGYNYRLGEIEAALALDQFRRIDENVAYRQTLAACLTARLSKIPNIIPPVLRYGNTHAWYTYPVRLIGMDKVEVCERLGEQGVYFGTYVKPLHLLPIYKKYGYKEGDCPVAERMWKEELIVTDVLRPGTTFEDMDRIVQAFDSLV